MHGFSTVRICYYFGGNPGRKKKVEVRMKKLKNGKAACKYEVTVEMIKSGYWLND